MRPRKHYIRPTAELTEDDLRELGRRLFDSINVDRLDDQIEEGKEDLDDGGCDKPAGDVT